MKTALFRATVKYDGSMVAAVAVIPQGPARLFIVQSKESPDLFIGRVSNWIKEQGAGGIEMQEPDVLPESIEIAEVLLRLKHTLGVGRDAPEASEYPIDDAELVLSTEMTKPGAN